MSRLGRAIQDSFHRPGDAVARVTSALGFRECGGCEQRHAAMNAVDTSKPVLEVAADLIKAIVSPPELPPKDEENK